MVNCDGQQVSVKKSNRNQSLSRVFFFVYLRALRGRSQAFPKSRANSTRLRTAIPDGPLAIHGLLSSIHAVPAMSRWIHGVSSANSCRNFAAEIAPPQRPPVFIMSAMLD